MSNKISKRFIEMPQPNKDILFVIKDGDNTLKATMCHNSISGNTFIGVKLSFFDDNYQYVQRNASWVFDLYTHNIREVLLSNGFSEVEPSKIEAIIYSGHPLLYLE